MNIRSLLVIAASVAVVTAGQAQQPAATTTQVVARVNGKDITRQELNTSMQATLVQLAQQNQSVQQSQADVFERQVLEDLITRELLLQEGRKLTITNLEDRVKAELTRIRDNLTIQEAVNQYVQANVKVTPEDIKAVYEQNREKLGQPATVRASHILIKVPANATAEEKAAKKKQIDDIRAKLKAGAKFADLAKQYSEDTGTSANGGDVGFFARGSTVVPEFDAVAFALKQGDISEVFTTQLGYHILIVTDQKAAKLLTYDEAKDRLEQEIRRQRGNEAIRNYVAKLRTSAKIETMPTAQPPPVTTTGGSK